MLPNVPTEASSELAEMLQRQTAPGELCREENGKLRCFACGHRCLIPNGKRGICKVRFNRGGKLHVPFGYVAGLACDPVEKKPFFHVYPGSDALTFGMLGCDFHCGYCQNWVTSQALRDPSAVAGTRRVEPRQLVEAALRNGARLIVSSYNEPLITAEWAKAVFEIAKPTGLACAFVSNGNATPEVLDYLQPYLTAYKVDLKSFNDKNYRELGGVLKNVLEGIRMVHERKIWLEIVTLLVPGFNDSETELQDLTAFIAGVSPSIPWHVTAFHQDYKMHSPSATTPEQLLRAAQIGKAAGLKFVYAGNAPDRVGSWENTRCPQCQTTLIKRHGYLLCDYRITAQSTCPDCGEKIPGVWPTEPPETKAGNWHDRLPRPVRV